MQWWMTGELLEQALELTSTFVQKVWALLTSGEAAAVAVGAAPDGGSSSSGGNSSSRAAPLLSEAYWYMVWVTDDLLVQLKANAEALHVAELQVLTSSGPQDTQQPTSSSSSKAWAKHMPLLLRPFEVFARSLAHHRQAPSSIVCALSDLLEAFVGPEALLASYWRPGPSRDLDPQLISMCFSLLKALETCKCFEAEDQAAEEEAAEG